ncbi:Protein of unknown function [Thermobacillus xylanilyticus]|uniref:Uncharacterized protein n=1 Tax=Thermobacillus xylanilyticus TaxID=76633 RepID=A0ABN7RJC5_THEXY|nr:Protein of unknown function [Thermobacillus xylanilyticus]
MAKADYFAANW